MNVAVLQLLFDQYPLCTGIPLPFPRYKIIVIMYVAVLELLFDEFTLCNGIALHFPKLTIFSIYMWQY